MTRIRLLIGTILLVMGPMNLGRASEAQAAEINQTIPASYFGLHIIRLVQTQPWYPNGDKKTPWPSIKFGSWRLWGAYVDWASLEPERGKWDFKTLDKYVALAEQAGVEIVYVVGSSPAWASARPNEPSGYRPGNAAEPKNIEDWRTYVRTVARRYKGRIKSYELWNEVNVKGFYSGSKEKLVELAKVAYETLKEVDPDIVFVSPSVVGAGEHYWLDEYFAKGGAKYLDVVGYHFYVPKYAPEAMLPMIQEIQSMMRRYGLERKPLWNTEIGWWISNKTSSRGQLVGPEADWRKLDGRLAAAYVARVLILSWPAGVSRVFWFGWDIIDMGLIEPGSLELKPAAFAFDTMARLLTGGVVRQCSQNGEVWMCPLVLANGQSGWAIWSGDDVDRDWNIPMSWNIVNVERIDGSNFKPNSRSIRIGAAPILLIAQ